MSWKTPGQPYNITIDGRDMKLRALTIGERMALAKHLRDDIKETETGVAEIYRIVSENIVELDGVDKDKIRAFIECQDTDLVIRIFNEIVHRAGLTEAERKNSESSSGTQS